MLSIVGALCRKSIKMQGEKATDTMTDKGHGSLASTPSYSDAVEYALRLIGGAPAIAKLSNGNLTCSCEKWHMYI